MAIPAVEFIWMNGRSVPWQEATVHVLTHGLHYGTGVFEGIRCYDTAEGPAIFRLRDHLERMQRSAKVVMMPLPYSTDELESATLHLVRSNDLRACYIRPIAYRGFGGLGLNSRDVPVDVAIAAWPWGTYLGEEALKSGIRVTVSSWRRNDPNVIPPDCKVTGAYINSCLATEEANAGGFEEAIMLNGSGNVAEGTGENLFLVNDGRLTTPGIDSGPLPGITRDTIIKLANDLGIPVVETKVTRSDLYSAEEAFCVGTAAEVVPIREVDGRVLGDPGPVTKTLQDKFFSIVRGEDEKYRDWFTFTRDPSSLMTSRQFDVL